MKRRVMILSTALSGGGAEQVTLDLINYLKESVCVVFENNDKIVPKDCRLVSLPPPLSRGRSITIAHNLLRLSCIQLLKSYYRPMVTISHLEGPNFANLLSLGGGKKVIVVHNSIQENYGRLEKRFDRLKKKLIGVLYKRASMVVVVSPQIGDELSELYGVSPERIRYIRNPIDRAWIQRQSAKRFGDGRDDLLNLPFLINIASLTLQKNHGLLLRAFASITQEYPDLRLFLLGKGPEERNIRKVCSELKLSVEAWEDGASPEKCKDAKVLLLGFQSNPYPFLVRSKLFALTSLWEGLPISVLEAMTLGKALVISDCSPTISELMGAKPIGGAQSLPILIGGEMASCGYKMRFFERPTDHDTIIAWAQAFRYLINDPELRGTLERQASSRSEIFDVKRTILVWEDLIQELTSSKCTN